MKTRTIIKRSNLREFTSTWSGELYNGFRSGVSWGNEPLEHASSEDIEQHRKHGSGLCWIESAANVLLNGGAIRKF